jgi:transposase-like protein
MARFTKTYEFNCPYCGESKIVKNGRQSGKQRYRCKGCAKQFNDTGALHGHRLPTNQVGAAIDMFYSGMSYKQIAEMMATTFHIPEPSKDTLYNWVKDYTDAAVEEMSQYPAHTSRNWVADEMQVKVGGERLWNWNVMDSETRYILASHLSPNRDRRAAVAVMRKAAESAAEPPKTIKTDKLGSYTQAIKEVFPETIHVQSQGMRSFTNNNRSERLQGTFRQREKTLRGLDNIETGQRYLDGWVIDYNLFREHESLDDRTPAEVAKVNPPFSEWEDVVKASPPDDRPRVKNLRETRARLADAEMPELRERPGVKFIGFKPPGRRRSHAPLVRTPARKVSPPAGKGAGVKVAAIVSKPQGKTSGRKRNKGQAHTYAQTRRAVQRSQRRGR